MADTGYARTMAPAQRYRRNAPERLAMGTDWETLEIWQLTPPSTEPWHVGAYCTADVDPGTVGQLRLRSSAGGVTGDAVDVASFARNVRLGFEGIANGAQLVYIEGRRESGSGGLRLVRSAVTAVSAPPASLQTSSPPGGGGGTGETPVATDVRATFVATDVGTTFTILPSWFSPAAQPGDKVVLIGAAPGPSENASHTWTFPGGVLATAAGGSFHPRLIATLVDYNEAGWTVEASNLFRSAAICFVGTADVVASTPVQTNVPVNPGAVSHDADAMAVNFLVVNWITSSVTGVPTSPAEHTSIISSPLGPRHMHAAKLARPLAGSYDPDGFTVNSTGEQATAVTFVAQPTTSTSGIAAPTVPSFSADVTLSTLSADIAAAVAAQPAGTHFQLVSGTYTNWSDVRPKTGMHFRGPASGTATLEGSGKAYCFRAIDATGSSDNVTISGPVGSIKIQNYGNGTARAEYGAIQAQPTDVVNGVFSYGCATGWFIQGVELSQNSSNGIRISDYCTVYQCTAYGHTVTGLGGDRNVGGLVHSCTFEANGLNPATGALSNGGNVKLTFHNGSEGRSDILPSSVLRAKAPFRLTDCTFNATKTGITGTCNIGFWADLDCQQIEVYSSTFTNHTATGIFFEGCNNVVARLNTVTNSDGYGPAQGGNFINGAICLGETTNGLVDSNTINDSDYALVNRMSNRSADWFNANNSSFVNYAWPTSSGGARYWITADGPTPIPSTSQRSNMWTGNNTYTGNILVNCNRVVINEGTNAGGMAAVGSTPLASIHFLDNDYSGSGSILFYDRSNTGISLTAWRALPYDRDQP